MVGLRILLGASSHQKTNNNNKSTPQVIYKTKTISIKPTTTTTFPPLPPSPQSCFASSTFIFTPHLPFHQLPSLMLASFVKRDSCLVKTSLCTSGNIGELKDLSTKKPILYLDFPQGQMKLFGTIVHPKNRYLTLQFSKGGKTVVCEDNFDNMIVFSDAWWIGKKDENPEELRLEFPKQMTEGKHADYDFKGGAGSTSEQKPGPSKPGKEQDEPQSPEAHVVDDVSEDSSALTTKKKDMMEVTPVRHSTRTAGKTFKLAEASSDDDSMKNGSDSSDLMEKRDIESLDDVVPGSTVRKTDDFSRATGSVDIAARPASLEENKKSSVTGKSKEIYVRKKGPLVQATLYSSFGKANKDEGPQKKETPVKERKIGTKENTKKSKSQVEDDDIEEFSSESEDIDGSDEDWTM